MAFKQLSPDCVRWSRGLHWSRLIGLPFLGFGLLMFYAVAILTDPEAMLLTILSILGVIFSVVGLLILFLRSVDEFDRKLQRRTNRWFMLVPLRTTTDDLAQFDRIVLCDEITTGAENFQHLSYPVELWNSTNKSTTLRIESFDRFIEARELAVSLADFMGFPLEDLTAHKPKAEIKSVGNKQPHEIKWPRLPRQSRIRYQMLRDGGIIEVVPSGFQQDQRFYILMAMVWLCLVYFAFLRNFLPDFLPNGLNFSTARLLFFVGGVYLFTLGPAFWMVGVAVKSATTRLQLIISLQGLQVTSRWLLWRITRIIPAKEISDFHIGGSEKRLKQPGIDGTVIKIVHKNRVLEFGGGLKTKELEWIYKILAAFYLK